MDPKFAISINQKFPIKGRRIERGTFYTAYREVEKAGGGSKALAVELGVSPSTVTKLYKRFGYPTLRAATETRGGRREGAGRTVIDLDYERVKSRHRNDARYLSVNGLR